MQEMQKRNSFIMCTKSECKLSNECYRHRARPDPDQLFDPFISICNNDDNYHFFMRIMDKDEIADLSLINEGGNNGDTT